MRQHPPHPGRPDRVGRVVEHHPGFVPDPESPQRGRKLLGRRHREPELAVAVRELPQQIREAGVWDVAALILGAAAGGSHGAVVLPLDHHRAVEDDQIRILEVFAQPLGCNQRVDGRNRRRQLPTHSGFALICSARFAIAATLMPLCSGLDPRHEGRVVERRVGFLHGWHQTGGTPLSVFHVLRYQALYRQKEIRHRLQRQ